MKDHSIGILRLKLGASTRGPTKAMFAQLDEYARQCNVCRNAMMRAWERWREDHPEFQAPPATNKDDEPIFRTRKGRRIPLLQNMPLPKDMVSLDPKSAGRARERRDAKGNVIPAREAGTVSCTSWLYQIGRRATPQLSAGCVTILAGEIWDRLTTKMPYNHDGNASYVWQAIIENEIDRGSFRAQTCPAKKSMFCLALFGTDRPVIYQGGTSPRLKAINRDIATLDASIWSRESGRGPIGCRVEIRNLSEGNLNVLRRILRGEWDMSDSEFVCRKGIWFLHLIYKRPVEGLGLNPERVAMLQLADKDSKSPFEIVDPDGKRWSLGHGKIYELESKRLESRRKAMTERRAGPVLPGTGRTSHGKERFYRDIRPISRRLSSIAQRLQQSIADEMLRFCDRFDCGTVFYAEPTMGARNHSWFAKRDLQFDWTRFLGIVRQKCLKFGIALQSERKSAKAKTAI